MEYKKTAPISLLLIVVIFLLEGCSGNKFMTAQKHFDQGEYYQAAEDFREVYTKLKDRDEKAEAVYKMGISYQKIGKYSKAVPWLKNAQRYQYSEEELPLQLAQANKAAGKLDESTSLLEEYLQSNPSEPAAKNSLEGTKLYTDWEENPSLYLVERESRLSSNWNEHALSFFGNEDSLLISSSREEASGKAINPVDGEKYADIFMATFDEDRERWDFPSKMKSEEINTSSSERFISYSPDGNQLILARSTSSENGPGKAQLYYSKKTGSQWSPLKVISFSQDGANYMQASWSANGNEIYFSSDRNGGFGGFDIWKSQLSSADEFTAPENLKAPINTPGNEVYPFERSNDVLYFSSDFHPGAGAQDIFKATREQGTWVIKNMELPMNSFADDFGIIFSKNSEKGFFLSNRKGSRGTDVYSFLLPPRMFMCYGKVFNNETDSVIPVVNIRVLGTDGSVKKLVTDQGKFHVELMPDNEYTLIAYKKGFLNAQAKISTKDLNAAKDFELEFKQTPTDKPIRLEQIYYETGKWNLLPSSQKSLDELVEILNINPEIRIEISAHTDEVGGDEFNQELSQKRANEVVQYLQQKGIKASRLVAKGYGEKRSFIVNAKTAKHMAFLKKGDRLTPEFIAKLTADQQEIAKSLNRRTEFEVIND